MIFELVEDAEVDLVGLGWRGNVDISLLCEAVSSSGLSLRLEIDDVEVLDGLRRCSSVLGWDGYAQLLGHSVDKKTKTLPFTRPSCPR